MEIKIDKGVVITNSAMGELREAMKVSEVGDSFMIPMSSRNQVATIAVRMIGKKFITRKIDEDNVRVWGIE